MDLMEMVVRLRAMAARGEIDEIEFDQAHKNILYGWVNVDDEPHRAAPTEQLKSSREH